MKHIINHELEEKTIEAIKTIKQRMQIAQSQQKSYANKKRRPVEFQEWNKVFLKVPPKKGILLFGKKGKLNPRYIEPFEILKRIGKVAQLASSISKFINDP